MDTIRTNSYTYEFDVASSTWTWISPIGTRVQLAGYSATFYAATRRIYVLGGYGPVSSSFYMHPLTRCTLKIVLWSL